MEMRWRPPDQATAAGQDASTRTSWSFAGRLDAQVAVVLRARERGADSTSTSRIHVAPGMGSISVAGQHGARRSRGSDRLAGPLLGIDDILGTALGTSG
jgi:hypothetical protein